ncbi:MAG: hypothetical protein M3068_11040 [Gemmatimonadota bacterium]|nr:hypothetical protein [Gemmatimonadota bacterium]
MVDKPQAAVQEIKPIEVGATPPPPPKRHPGHRNTDVRDTVAEMAARAQEISQEAGSKVAQAMKDVIGAAAGLAGFAVESARDLVQYMVRRGQMTQDEADKLMREAEEAHSKKKPTASAEPKRAAAPAAAAKSPAKPALKPAPKVPLKARARPAPKAVAKAVAKPAKAAAKPAPKKKASPHARSKSPAKKAAGKKKR